jgi:hypothetical protein
VFTLSEEGFQLISKNSNEMLTVSDVGTLQIFLELINRVWLKLKMMLLENRISHHF